MYTYMHIYTICYDRKSMHVRICDTECVMIARLCNTLQHTATHSNTFQRITRHCNTLQHTAPHRTTPHHAAPHCTTLQHTATQCSTLQLNACIVTVRVSMYAADICIHVYMYICICVYVYTCIYVYMYI